MKKFNIYTHKLLPTEIVKDDWSWPAFFFVPFWALAKKLWLVFFVYCLLIFIVIVFFAFSFFEDSFFANWDTNKITGSDFMILASGILFGAYGNTWRVNKLNKLGYIYSHSVNAKNYKIALNSNWHKAPITGKEPSTKTKENKYTSSPGVSIDSEGIPSKIKAESSISKEENQENAASKERPKETKKSKSPISDDDSEYASKLKEAKSLLNDELINKADYEKIKKKIIDNL